MTMPDSTPNLPAVSQSDITRDLVKQIAMDIGKEVVTHIEIMYPATFKAVAKIAKLSVRNCVYNEIMAALEVTDEGAIVARIQDRKELRRRRKAVMKIGRWTITRLDGEPVPIYRENL